MDYKTYIITRDITINKISYRKGFINATKIMKEFYILYRD